jgi:hypothetical protein
MKKLIVYDSDHPGALNNRCFEEDYAFLGSGNSFTVLLGAEAKKRGYGIVTADVFLKETAPKGIPIVCITDMHSKYTEKLLASGVKPLINYCTESPLIAKDFYSNIKRLAGRYVYNYQFRGTRERLVETKTSFNTLFYPVDNRQPMDHTDWPNRKFLVLINRNKRAFFSGSGDLKSMVRTTLSRGKFFIKKITDPWIRSKEIYKDRVEAIAFFSKDPGFHLYGQGWKNPIPGFSQQYSIAAKRAYKGEIAPDKKLQVMNQYKFSICFENCSFPGYVTEKIFDCFLAGCIPIYFGAPDIKDFVPADSFIDFRKFKDFTELSSHLKAIGPELATAMLESASEFLKSKQFDKHYAPNIVDDMLTKIEEASNQTKL